MDILEHLIEDYGLETLLEQNDIEPRTVLELLINKGLIDLEDYTFGDIDDDDSGF